MKCPKCEAECHRDAVHNGIAMLYGPWGCPACAWSEMDEYDLSMGKDPSDAKGGVIDQYGGYHPPGSPKAQAYWLETHRDNPWKSNSKETGK